MKSDREVFIIIKTSYKYIQRYCLNLSGNIHKLAETSLTLMVWSCQIGMERKEKKDHVSYQDKRFGNLQDCGQLDGSDYLECSFNSLKHNHKVE